MAIIQALPSAPTDAPPQTRQSLQAIINVLNQLTGSGTGRAMTKGDLVGTGLAASSSSGALVAASSIVAIPLQIVGLVATGAFASIFLSWDAVTQKGYAHVEIWRSSANDISTAVFVGSASAPMFDDTPPNSLVSATYYYWVRAVNTNGISGPFNAVSGTSGSTSNDPAYALEILTGQITSTQLHTDLTSRINLIDAAGTGLVATANLLNVNQIALQTTSGLSADALLSNAVAIQDKLNAHFLNKGNIASLTNTVTQVQTGLNSEITTRTQLEAKLNAATALYSTSSTAAANALTAIAGNTTVIQAQIDQNIADINSSNGVVSTKVGAEAVNRNTLQVAMIGAANPATANLSSLSTGMIHEEKTARISNVGAINTTLLTLQAGFVSADGSLNTAINTRSQTAEAYADSVAASSSSTLRSEFNSIKASWSGATDPSTANYIHYGDLWFDQNNLPQRWSLVSSGSIIGCSKANPAVVTSTGHGLSTGQRIQIESVGGMVELNTRFYTITSIDANSFSLNNIDSTGYTTFSASGIDTWSIGVWVDKQDKRFDTLVASITSNATASADASQSLTNTMNTALSGSQSAADAILAQAVGQDAHLAKTYASVALIQTEQTTRVDAVQAQANRVDTLTAGFVSADGSLNTAIDQVRSDAVATADTAAASRVATLQASITGNGGTIDAKVGALKTALVGTYASVGAYLTANNIATTGDITAQLSQYDPTAYATFASKVAAVSVTAPGGGTANISNLSAAMMGVDINGNPLSLATAVKQVSVSDGVSTGTIEQKMIVQKSATDTINAESTVKLDVNGKVAGVGLMNDGATSLFEVAADKFVIAPPVGSNATALSPFAVDATAGMVLMNGASIVDATITNAKIASLVVDKITAGNLTATIGITTGNLKTGAASSLDMGIGVWIGNNVLRAGNPAGNHIKWNGSSLVVQGIIKDTNGNGVDNTSTVIDAGLVTTGGIQGGMQGYLNGIGFFLGHQSGIPKFSVGNSNGEYLSWNGDSMKYRGSFEKVVTPGTDVLFTRYSGDIYLNSYEKVLATVASGSAGRVNIATSGAHHNAGYYNAMTATFKFYHIPIATGFPVLLQISYLPYGYTNGTADISASATFPLLSNVSIAIGDKFYMTIIAPAYANINAAYGGIYGSCTMEFKYTKQAVWHNL